MTTTFIDSSTLQFSLAKDFFTLSGSYSINVVAPQTAPSSPVTFTVGAPPPVFAGTGVLNAASYASGDVAPAEIVTVFGTNFGTMGNTSVTFDGLPANPASTASVVALYGTAGGALTADTLPKLTLPVTATVGGVPATVYYAGIAPGLVEGAMLVNVQIPRGVTPGPAVPVAITVGTATSNTVTLAIP